MKIICRRIDNPTVMNVDIMWWDVCLIFSLEKLSIHGLSLRYPYTCNICIFVKLMLLLLAHHNINFVQIIGV